MKWNSFPNCTTSSEASCMTPSFHNLMQLDQFYYCQQQCHHFPDGLLSDYGSTVSRNPPCSQISLTVRLNRGEPAKPVNNDDIYIYWVLIVITRWEAHEMDLRQKNGFFVWQTMAKYKFLSSLATKWELVEKFEYLLARPPQWLPTAQIGNLSEKNLELSRPKSIPQIFWLLLTCWLCRR